MMKKTTPEDVDQYIAGFPAEIQAVLQSVRKVIRSTAPAAREVIKYGIPTYVLNGNFVHFGGFSKHIAIYPAPRKSESLREKIAPYLSGQSTLKFALDQRLPLALIREIVRYLAEENMKKLKKGEIKRAVDK